MGKEEIIERLEEIAKHAVHVLGEEPFLMSLDDGIAIHEAIEILKGAQPSYTDEEVQKMQDLEQAERKKGKWLHKSKQLAALNTAWWYECSICGYHAFNGMRTDFCPNCGADMRGNEDD